MFGFIQSRGPQIRVQKKLVSELRLFKDRPELINKGKYTIKSDVDPDVVDLFFSRVGGDTDECVKEETVEQLRALCDELGFSGFDDEIRAVLGSDSKARKDLMSLRGRVDRHDVIVEELRGRVLELERQLLGQRVVERVEAVERRVDEIRRNDVEEVKRKLGALREEAQQLRSDVRERARAADVAALSREVAYLKEKSGEGGPDELGMHHEPLPYDRQNPLNGIIAHLTRECQGNVYKKRCRRYHNASRRV